MNSLKLLVALAVLASVAIAETTATPDKNQTITVETPTRNIHHPATTAMKIDSAKECFVKVGLVNRQDRINGKDRYPADIALMFYTKDEIRMLISELQKYYDEKSCLK